MREAAGYAMFFVMGGGFTLAALAGLEIWAQMVARRNARIIEAALARLRERDGVSEFGSAGVSE